MKYILFGAIGYALFLLLAYLLTEKFVFRPTDIPQDYSYSFSTPFQELFLKDEGNGLNINALYFTAPESKGCVLYFHGNTGSLDRWGYAHNTFTNRGYDALIIDYPGYGKSNKSSTEKTVYQSAEMAYKWVQDRYDADQIVIYGRSIGGGPAAYITRKHPAQQLILETPFYSMDQILKHYAPFIYYLLPTKVSLPVGEYISNLDIPITIIHGTKDKIVPYSSAKKLKSRIKSSDRFLTIDGGGHNNMMEYPAVHDELDRCLNTIIKN